MRAFWALEQHRADGEQSIESRHGFYNQNAPQFTAETALLSFRKLLQMMALTGVASDSLRRSKAPIRKRKAGPRGSLQPGDRILRHNKTWRRECFSTLQKRMDERAKRATDQFEEANGVVQTYILTYILPPVGSLQVPVVSSQGGCDVALPQTGPRRRAVWRWS